MTKRNISSCYSKVSTDYKVYRPSYPSELFELISSLTPEHSLALDVATGSGQAAVNLSKFYNCVKATDLCVEQLKEAPKLTNIEYLHLPAELTEAQCIEHGFQLNSFDVITCATAIHWIDVKKFFPLAQQLLKKPNGVLAILQYVNPPTFGVDEIDKILQEYRQRTQPLVEYTISNVTEETYKTMYFPFENIATSWENGGKQFVILKEYGLADIKGDCSCTSTSLDK